MRRQKKGRWKVVTASGKNKSHCMFFNFMVPFFLSNCWFQSVVHLQKLLLITDAHTHVLCNVNTWLALSRRWPDDDDRWYHLSGPQCVMAHMHKCHKGQCRVFTVNCPRVWYSSLAQQHFLCQKADLEAKQQACGGHGRGWPLPWALHTCSHFLLK